MVKPKDFKIPFARSSAHVELQDKVLFLPPQCDLNAFSLPDWSSPALFNNTNPIHVEFCSGNGSWIIEKALSSPNINWIAVEIRFDRVRKIWSKAKNFNLTNLLVVFGDARVFSQKYISPSSISSLYINFPDPWPKKRHAKHRIISPSFFENAHSILQEDGRSIFVTDDQEYSNLFLELESSYHHLFRNENSLGYTAPPSSYGTSFFDSLFRSQGKPIFYHELRKIPCKN